MLAVLKQFMTKMIENGLFCNLNHIINRVKQDELKGVLDCFIYHQLNIKMILKRL